MSSIRKENMINNLIMKEAISRGSIDTVKRLLGPKGYSSEYTNYNEAMVLREAVKSNSIDVVKLMLKDDIDAYNKVMAMAAYYGSADIANLMLEKGANNIKETIELTDNYENDNVLRIFSDDTIYKNRSHKLLDDAIRATSNGHIDVVKYMLENGADNYNETLKEAASNGHIDVVKLIIGENPNGYDDFDSNEYPINHYIDALIEAVSNGHLDIVKYMISEYNDDDDSPIPYNRMMVIAALNGHIDVVKLMLKKGADNYDDTMYNAARGAHIDIVKLMLGKGANNYNEVMEAAALKREDEDVIPLEEDRRFDIIRLMEDEFTDEVDNDENMSYDNVLQNAVESGFTSIVNLVLESEDDNLQFDTEDIIHGAVRNNYIDIVMMLLDHLDIDDEEEDISRKMYNDILTLVVQHVSDKPKSPYEPLELARLMLYKGADKYDNAIDIAIEYGNDTILEMLLLETAQYHDEKYYNIILLDAINAGTSMSSDYRSVELIIDMGATNLNEAMKLAIENIESPSLSPFYILTREGADNYDEVLQIATDIDVFPDVIDFIRNEKERRRK